MSIMRDEILQRSLASEPYKEILFRSRPEFTVRSRTVRAFDEYVEEIEELWGELAGCDEILAGL